ncbi:endolytic transglycosylase MltG [Elongatibacter sediminis]|uniref:Endolytic murein transglycosylase n=1 Tax=Elongatibacter sediminis TaxID=3119006 RepID=A0AAW9RH75_9GAMM
MLSRGLKWLAGGLALAAGVAALAGWLAWRDYQAFLSTPLRLPAEGRVLVVEPGMSGISMVTRLADMGVTRNGWTWRLLLRLEPAIIQAGEYRLETGMKPADLLGRLTRGDVIRYRFTIVEGWTVRQLLDALAADPVLGAGVPPDAATTVLPTLVDGHVNPEGWFLPETYSFVRGDSYRELLLRSHRDMRAALEQAWAARHEDHPVTSPYELLILASIIEKETAVEAERGDVSGVFVRRLRRGMRLQTDPTVIYGIGEAYDGDIRRRDLVTDTPYNTYTRHGLPPTPIALPGRASLMAAAQPRPGDALFFVADGAGGHTFSATLEEHEKAVKKLLERTP